MAFPTPVNSIAKRNREMHLILMLSCVCLQYHLMVLTMVFLTSKLSAACFLGDGFDLFGRWYVNSRSNYQRYRSSQGLWRHGSVLISGI